MSKTNKAQGWAERIAEFEGSGLSRVAWCAGQGFSANTLDYWRVRPRGKAVPTDARPPTERADCALTPTLVPIVVESASKPGGARSTPAVETELPSGVRIRLLPEPQR